jgi:hypothetical protein
METKMLNCELCGTKVDELMLPWWMDWLDGLITNQKLCPPCIDNLQATKPKKIDGIVLTGDARKDARLKGLAKAREVRKQKSIENKEADEKMRAQYEERIKKSNKG